MLSAARVVLLTSLFTVGYGLAQVPPPVPSAFQAAYSTVSTDIANFSATLNSQGNIPQFSVLRSGQLQTVNSDLTTNLLQPNYYQMTVLSELNSLQALGVQAVTFHINFPALYQPYYSNPADYQSYLSFYTTLVNEIRSRGLKIEIESTIAVVYPGNNSNSFVPYYQSLTWPVYEAQRAQLVASIAQLFHPDYLVVVAEPSTEANSTFQPNADTVAGSTDMVNQMLTAIQATGVTGVQVGAGSGTWDPNFLGFIQSFCALPLDFIDMHVYPVNVNNLPNALTAVGIIQTAGKQPSMSEFWSYKETDQEYQANLPYTTIYARDAFSFWGPIDVSFLQMMYAFGNYGHFAFMTPFWSHYYYAYLDYAVYGGLPDATVITNSNSASTAANMVGAFTPTGQAYENLLLNGVADTTPPSQPAPPTLVSYSQTQANLSWTPSRDNIGVAAYNIYRNNNPVPIATISSPLTYYDSTLTANTTYTYTVAAFDASGNMSGQSAPLTFTTYPNPDHTPPSVPLGVSAAGTLDTQISINWLPSVDNVQVSGYEIYRGTTPSSITPYATSTVNAYKDIAVGPAKTYYYQIDAYDASGNHSARSAVAVGVSLPDVTPPTTPTNLAAISQSPTVVSLSWTGSVDDYMVSTYIVYRGTSPTSLKQIGYTPAAQLTYIDSTAVALKTYFYAVAATDPSKNQSPQSTVVSITTP